LHHMLSVVAQQLGQTTTRSKLGGELALY